MATDMANCTATAGATADQTSSAKCATPGKQIQTESHPDSVTLKGDLLVSNNPEGLTSAGKIMVAPAKAGALEAYIHHSNHREDAALTLYMIVKPKAGTVPPTTPLTYSGFAATGYEGGIADDPNYIVARDSVAPGNAKANEKQKGSLSLAQPATIKIATLPVARSKQDQPLLDARYDLKLPVEADVEIVAEMTSVGAAGAVQDSRWAAGNTKYQDNEGKDLTNGRGAGIYKGAEMDMVNNVRVSELEREKILKRPLTQQAGGTARVTPTLETPASSAMTVGAGQPSPLHGLIATAMKSHSPDPVIAILGNVFRISSSWLNEKGLLTADQQHFVPISKPENYPTMPDYIRLIQKLQTLVKAGDVQAVTDYANKRLGDYSTDGSNHSGNAGSHSANPGNYAANGDYASYGTHLKTTFYIRNDTAKQSTITTKFETVDFFRGALIVNSGNPKQIDSGNGQDLVVPIETTPALAPRQEHELKLEYVSPGQIQGGQNLVFTAK